MYIYIWNIKNTIYDKQIYIIYVCISYDLSIIPIYIHIQFM